MGKAVSPTPTTIEDGSYAPFSRPLFIYVNANSFKRPEVRQFIGYYLVHAPKLAARKKGKSRARREIGWRSRGRSFRVSFSFGSI